MNTHPFTCRQLCNRDYQKIQRQVSKYYYQSKNLLICLKLICALQIRRRLSAEKLALPAVEVAREIYLTNPATPELAVYIYEYSEYFSPQEWHFLMEKYASLVGFFVLVKLLGEKLAKITKTALFFSG